MSAPGQMFSPPVSRRVIAFVGAVAGAVAPVALGIATGIEVTDDRLWILLSVMLPYCACFLVGVFLAGQWAARIAPDAKRAPIALDELRQRLLALNARDLAFRVREDGPTHLVAEWRPATVPIDSAMLDGEERVWRSVRIRLVEARHEARAIDLEGEAAWGDGRFGWFRRFRVFRGIRFGVEDSRQPLVAVVLRGGWSWQPVIFR